jgi:hypothetical protein
MTLKIKTHASLQTLNLTQAAAQGDLRGLGRPGGDGARSRDHPYGLTPNVITGVTRTVGKKFFQTFSISSRQRPLEIGKMNEMRLNAGYLRNFFAKRTEESVLSKGRKGRGTAEL